MPFDTLTGKRRRPGARAAVCAALVLFAVLQVPAVRTGLIEAAAVTVGRSLNPNLWSAVLQAAGFVAFALTVVWLLLHAAPRFRHAAAVYFTSAGEASDGQDALTVRRVCTGTGFVVLFCALAATGATLGVSMFNTDSWGYVELAKTVFGGDFYRFNTYRSYYSHPYSTSFPLGYPVLIALLQFVFGTAPAVSVWLNIALALATWLVILRVARQIGLVPLAGFAIATGLLLWNFYLDEVFAGHSIPAALLVLLAGCSAYLSRWMLAAGLLLGSAVLIRFDYLAFTVLVFAAMVLLDSRPSKTFVPLAVGFVAGVSPWLLYSLGHFGRPWVSDSSWVALAVHPAYVVDFPAVAAVTALDQPALWLSRVARNIGPLLGSAAAAVLTFPVLIALAALFAFGYARLSKSPRRKAVFGLAVLLVSLLPYLMTGYSDKRYFSFLFLFAAGVLAHASRPLAQMPRHLPAYTAALLISLTLSLLLGAGYLARKAWASAYQHRASDVARANVETLRQCSAEAPQVTYVFADDNVLAARYGAITGRSAAFIPSNFKIMTTAEKKAFFDAMRPYAIVDDTRSGIRCPETQ